MTTPSHPGSWWARRWQTLLKQLGLDAHGDASALRGCRVKRLEVMPGLIQAQVQDREVGAAAVEIRLPVLDDVHWDRVIAALGSQAIYAAQLLAGNMPPEIEDVFAQAGAALLPASAHELTQTCSSCAPGERPCRPLAAVYWQLGEMLAEDPWLLLRLRGRDRQQVLAAVHQQRNTAAADAVVRPTAPAFVSETKMPAFYTPVPAVLEGQENTTPTLEEQLNDFWGRRKVLEDIHHHLARPLVELALLRRLGPPTPAPDGQEAYTQLQTVYRRVTERVWTLAFAPDQAEESAALDSNGTE
jgi:uncharacterized Zn finger protein